MTVYRLAITPRGQFVHSTRTDGDPHTDSFCYYESPPEKMAMPWERRLPMLLRTMKRNKDVDMASLPKPKHETWGGPMSSGPGAVLVLAEGWLP